MAEPVDMRPDGPRQVGSPPATLSRSLGAFVGHIWSALRRDPAAPTPASRVEVRRSTEVQERGDVVLRRTTIEEIEYRGDGAPQAGPQPSSGPASRTASRPAHGA